MCQPRAQGGRRCPLHQPATIALSKSLVLEHRLIDKQIEHTFQGLRRAGANREAPTPQQYAYFIQRQKEMLERSRLSDRDKEKVKRHLDKQLSESELPDGATFYALNKLRPRVREQKREFVQIIKDIATHHGVNRNVALRKFQEAYAAHEAQGSSRLNDTFDAKTLEVKNALLGQESTTADGQPEFSTEPRITRQPAQSSWISEIGYDSDDGRLEVETRQGQVYAYRNVSQAQWDHLQDNPSETGSYVSRNIMRNPDHAYSSRADAARDAFGRYCQDCHKYKAISGHVCDGSAAEAREAAVTEDIRAAVDNTTPVEEVSEADVPQYSYEESLARVRESLMAENTASSEPEEEPEEERPRQRRQRRGPTARQRRWLVPVGDRETQTFNRENTDYGRLDRRSSLVIPKPTAIKKAVVSEGKVAKFDLENRFSYYSDGQGFQTFTIKQEMEAYVDNEDGNIKFAVRGRKCSCAAYAQNYTCEHVRGETGANRRGYGAPPENEEAWDRWAERQVQLFHRKMDSGSYLRQKALAAGDENPVFTLRQDNSNRRRRSVMLNSTVIHRQFSASQKREIRNLLNNGQAVELRFEDPYEGPRYGERYMDRHNYSGSVVLHKNDEDEIAVKEHSLKCDMCGLREDNPNCEHADTVSDYVLAMVDGRVDEAMANRRGGRSTQPEVPSVDYNSLSVEDRLRMVEEQTSSSWLADSNAVQDLESAFSVPSGVDNSYTTNLDQYIKDVREAEERSGRGESAIPYTKDNPTNGICSPESGRAFGVELEFDVTSGGGLSKDQRLAKIGRELHEAGLTETSHQQRYHANRVSSNPYTRWTFERDCTVDAEIVSPKLHDTPETWEQIEKVCEIVKRNGGKATVKTGGHVHMGLGSGSPAEVARRKVGVTQIYAAFQDSMRRVQANPSRKKHRASQWAPPMDDSTAQSNIYSIREGRRVFEDHNASLNLGHEGRVEFRGADGSLNPAHIQAQVVVAAGVVAAAERGEYEGSNVRLSKVGDNSKKVKAITKGETRKLSDDELIVSDVEMRKFADTVLNWDSGRKVVAGTAANTPWQEG